MTTVNTSPTTTAKNWLSNAERNSGAIATWLVAGAAILGAYAASDLILGILNFGIAAIGKTIVLGGLAFVAWMFFMWITNPRTQVELKHLNYRWCRVVSRQMMKSDPFGRMKAFANEYLQEQWDKFNEAATRVEAQLGQDDPPGGVKGKLVKQRAIAATARRKAEAIQQQHYKNGQWDADVWQNNYRIESQRTLQAEEAIEKLEKSNLRLTALVKILDRWRETFRFQIESTRMTADHLEQQFNEARDTDLAVNAAASAFGGGDMASADEEVRKYIEDLTQQHLSSAASVMKQIPELTAFGNLQGDMAEAEMMRRLQSLDEESKAALSTATNDTKAIEAGDSNTTLALLQSKAAEPVQARRKYLGNNAA